MTNPILSTDYYKYAHHDMYAPRVEGIFSYAESRGGIYKEMVFFGLQIFLSEMMANPITLEDIDEAESIALAMGGVFNREPWEVVVNEYGGYPPFIIKAVKEGTVLPVHNAVTTVECTDKRCYSLVGVYETALLRAIWFPSTIATRAFHIRKTINAIYQKFADTSASADFAFLDFSARGVESHDASAIGTAAFLTSFKGTDTVAGVALIKKIYGGGIHGFSVPATEHSVMCSYGEENEAASFARLVNAAPNGSTLSVVSDTWNIYRACSFWNNLSTVIRDKNLTLVVRPDSGRPEEVLVQMINILKEGFYTGVTNDKGLRLFDNLKILWGDGIDESNVADLFLLMVELGWAPENLILGSGGGLMQKVNRDTMKWAFKASAVLVKGTWAGIKKEPITDPGKRSKSGKLELIKEKKTDEIKTVDWSLAKQLGSPLLDIVYDHGNFIRHESFEEITSRIHP